MKLKYLLRRPDPFSCFTPNIFRTEMGSKVDVVDGNRGIWCVLSPPLSSIHVSHVFSLLNDLFLSLRVGNCYSLWFTLPSRVKGIIYCRISLRGIIRKVSFLPPDLQKC